MRYNATERVGINAANHVVTSDLQWIFRDQPIVDVGVDAMIEECSGGDPTGYFIAAQIKSGEGNFYLADDRLVYYVTNIHYNYWTNLNIPIVIICYLPKTNLCYWQSIDQSTLLKTDTRWKLEIPYTNVLNAQSKEQLRNLQVRSAQADKFGEAYLLDDDEEISEYTSLMVEARTCVTRINELMGNSTQRITEFAEILKQIPHDGRGLENPIRQGAAKQLSKHILLTAKRLSLEISIYSKVFPDELYALERLLYSIFVREEMTPSYLVDVTSSMPTSIAHAIQGINALKDTVSVFKSPSDALNDSFKYLSDSLASVLSEYESSKELSENLCSGISATQA